MTTTQQLQDEYYALLWEFKSINKFDSTKRAENLAQRKRLKSKINTLKKQLWK